jgi:phospholipid/cholesterol/gamma-HCH transport system substrate-binding protein
MEERDKKTELLVGLFLFVGLVLLGLLILQFGTIRELFKTTYPITVALPDGSGIKAGSPVMLGGSPIGKVNARPSLNANFNGVIIPLEIYHDKKIPADAKFSIGTSGLLGDAFIEIKSSGKPTDKYLSPGSVPDENIAKGGGMAGLQDTAVQTAKKVDEALGDLQKVAADLRVSLKQVNEGALSTASMKDLTESFKHLNSVMTRLDEKTLDEKTVADLKQTITNLKQASESLDAQIKRIGATFDKLDPAFSKADKVMVSAEKAMKTIDESAASLGRVANDIRKGNGLLPALINDAQLKGEFKMLITNLRQRGVLWYKDKAGEEQSATVKPPLTGSKR